MKRSIRIRFRRLPLIASALALASCASAQTSKPNARVGPQRGSVVVVGGGALGDDILGRFIQLAGGPQAPIVVVPTAGGAPAYPDAIGAVQLRAAGAKNVVVLHTYDRKIANTDSFVAPLKRARGVWFDGGRHFRLVDVYAGTKSERAFHQVLARGGVVGGTSAGASILASYLVRGAPSNNNFIMAYPGYEKGFGFLRGVAIDQHVVARERLADLADSVMPRHPELLGISEDEGTAWIVRGNVGEIVGRNKAFVYGGPETDAGAPFLTLRPGDTYDLAQRRVVRRAIDDSPLTQAFVDSLFAPVAQNGATKATVLVAEAGKVYVNSSYGVPPQPKFMPTTTVPNFDVGQISAVLPRERRALTAAGVRKTVIDTASGVWRSNVDELYRLELVSSDGDSTGWSVDHYKGAVRESVYGTAEGKRNALVRFPERRATIIILTDDDDVDARSLADQIADRLLRR